MSSSERSLRRRLGGALLTIATCTAAMVLGANVYQTIVEVPNWAASPPSSVAAFRPCFAESHPGYFFQVLVPTTILALVVSTILGWRGLAIRDRWLLAALAGLVAAEVFTAVYFFPRNEILFFGPLGGASPELVAETASEWENAHYLRMAMLFAGVACCFGALRHEARIA